VTLLLKASLTWRLSVHVSGQQQEQGDDPTPKICLAAGSQYGLAKFL
jgi:hypothetical protein